LPCPLLPSFLFFLLPSCTTVFLLLIDWELIHVSESFNSLSILYPFRFSIVNCNSGIGETKHLNFLPRANFLAPKNFHSLLTQLFKPCQGL
jgi:hypothetical protein